MHRVAIAVTDGTPLYELAAACEVFGADRELTESWYDLVICGRDGAAAGGWLTAGIQHDLAALADADTVIFSQQLGVPPETYRRTFRPFPGGAS